MSERKRQKEQNHLNIEIRPIEEARNNEPPQIVGEEPEVQAITEVKKSPDLGD